MRISMLFKLAAAAGLVLAAPAASVAQIGTVDPNDVGEYEPAAVPEGGPAAQDPAAPQDEYLPVDTGSEAPEPEAAAPAAAAPASTVQGNASERASADMTVPPEDVFSAAEGVFGKG